MKVYCPCGKQCKGFSGSPRKCEPVGGSSGIMPQEFIDHNMDQQEGFFGKLLVGAGGIFGGAVVEKAGGKLTYSVYRCPGCKCKVLVQSIKNGNSTNTEEVGKISRCGG